MPVRTDWSIAGSEAEPIEVTSSIPDDVPRGHAVIVHGFLGYKDYGLFPRLADRLAATGLVAHRINLSHSGVRGDPGTFARPDLFERDTWKKQAFDVGCVLDALGFGAEGAQGSVPGSGAWSRMPIALIGHSRGGVTSLLAAADRFERNRAPLPTRIITLAAPAACCSWDDATKQTLLEDGFVEIKSNRTGQTLRVGRAWLSEQLEDPAWHDVPARVRTIRCPVLVVHGSADPTVPAESADTLAGALGARGERVIVEGGDHVFNTPNPFAEGEPASAPLKAVLERVEAFLEPLGRA